MRDLSRTHFAHYHSAQDSIKLAKISLSNLQLLLFVLLDTSVLLHCLLEDCCCCILLQYVQMKDKLVLGQLKVLNQMPGKFRICQKL